MPNRSPLAGRAVLPFTHLLVVLALLSYPLPALSADQNQAIATDVLEGIGDETAGIDEPSSPNDSYSSQPQSWDSPSSQQSTYWRLDEGSETHSLSAGNDKFRALFKKDTTGKPVGALILIHDIDHNPDWSGPIRLIRRQLPHFGWTTLSLQIETPQPQTSANSLRATAGSSIKTNGKKIERSKKILQQRVRSAFTFLNQKGLYNIVVIAQGVHASYTVSLLKDVPPSSIAGFISLNIKTTSADKTQKIAQHMSQIKAPILDLIPEITARHGFAQQRIIKAKQNAKQNYQQYAIPGTDPSFRGVDDFLIKRIRGWLKTNAGGMEAILQSPQKSNR